MLKRMRLLLVTCACVCLALFAVACSSGSNAASSSSSSGGKVSMGEATDATAKSDNAFYALIIGDDSRYGTTATADLTPDSPSFSDVMILMRVDMDTYRISLVSIPRDIGIDLDGKYDKLNSAYYVGGADRLAEEVEKLTGVQVSYTIDLGFLEYRDFIDALGGVQVNVPFDFDLGDIFSNSTIYLSAGDDQTLDGAEALVFARMRKGYGGSQEGSRQYQNRHTVQGLIQAALDRPASEADSLVDILYPLCETNMSEDEMKAYVKDFMENADKVTFQLGTYPYDGGINEETELWQITYDEDTFMAVTEAIENGTSIQDIVPDPDIYPAE